jgi:CDP-glucose 4,6-dehydratase
MDANFWRGKRVLLTGHTGFKGAWCALWLRNLGAEVVGYALPPPTEPCLFTLAKVGDAIESVFGDVRDLSALRTTMTRFRPELVIHMAAQALVIESYQDPVGTYSTNVMGTVHVLESVRHTPSVRATVIVTSDKCYENREWLWGYRENEPMGGHDPYSNSKGCAELVTDAYRRSFFPIERLDEHRVAVASVRAGNVIGGGDWAKDRLVPDAVQALQSGKRLVLRNPDATRPWQHVLDPLHGYLTLAERLFADGRDFASGWNFGPDDESARRVRDVVDGLARLWGGDGGWELAEGAKPHEARSLRLDCQKARALLGWRPRLGFDQALEWTHEWYDGVARGGSAAEICTRQLTRFASVCE